MGGAGAASGAFGASGGSGGGAGGHTVSPVEAARISAVLEDTIEKLSFLAAITPDMLVQREEVVELTSGEIARLIAEQRALEARFEDLISQRAALKGAGNKTRYKEIQAEIQSVSYQLRESMKNLCRSLKVRAGGRIATTTVAALAPPCARRLIAIAAACRTTPT